MAPKRAMETSEGGSPKKPRKESKPMEAPPRPPGGNLCYLVKRASDVLSLEDFEAAPNKTLAITGMNNYPAKKVIATMQEGDEVLFYSSLPKKKVKGEEPGIVAFCTVAKGPYPDPEDDDGKGFLAFDLKLEETFDSPILLPKLKDHKDDELNGLTLFTQPMLPVSWVKKEHFDFLYDTLGAEGLSGGE